MTEALQITLNGLNRLFFAWFIYDPFHVFKTTFHHITFYVVLSGQVQ